MKQFCKLGIIFIEPFNAVLRWSFSGVNNATRIVRFP